MRTLRAENTAAFRAIHASIAIAPRLPAHTGCQRLLLVAERATAWPAVAETCREQGVEVSILLQHAGEPEPTFARRLSTVVARAQLEGQPFDGALMLVNDELGQHSEPARMRLLALLSQTLLRTAHPVAIHVDCAAPASAPLLRSLERIHRAVARQFRDFALVTLQLGAPSFEARTLATG